MGAFGLISVFVVILAIIIGILNFSPDDSPMYRVMFDTELKNNIDNFYFGCFCVTNKLDSQTIQVGDKQFCATNGCTNELIVLNNTFYKDIILKGDVGIGETYFNKYWTYNADLYDLGDLMTEFLMGISNGTESIFAGKYAKYLIIEQWYQWYDRAYAIRKTVAEDKDSIAKHYDIGNDLYESFLDATMMYSCAFWGPRTTHTKNKDGKMSLFEAQNNKIDYLTAKMGVTSKDNVLDIGSGWGYTAHNINRKTNANVTGITISENQFAYQKNKYKEYSTREVDGNTNFVNFKLLDYRNVDVLSKLNVNKIISIGMYEHVGIRNIDEYFSVASKIFETSMKINRDNGVKKDYVFGLHYFTNADITPGKIEINKNIACDQQTFIFKYIFPGLCLIHPDWTVEVARNHGFLTLHQETFGYHYAKTLKIWRDNWRDNFKELQKNNPSYDEKLYLLYEIYFAFCEAMFRTGHVQLIQQIFIKYDSGGDENNARKLYSRFDNIEDRIQIPERTILAN